MLCAALGVWLQLSAGRYGLINISVAPLREEPSHSAEMGTEAVIGTPLLLDSVVDDEWWLLQMPCGYRGYIHVSSVQVLTDEEASAWRSARRLESCVPMAWLVPDGEPLRASYVPYGGLVEFLSDAGHGRVRVRLPSGERAIAPADNFREFKRGKVFPVTAEDIERVILCAKAMTGSPYLWGGTTMLAPDCSGFTQLCWREAGVLLPRNASQQASVGEEVSGLESAQRGDLLFFTSPTGRVDHVALYLGEGGVIQSSARVWEGTLLKERASVRFPYYGRKVAYIRRLKSAPAGSIRLISSSPLYFNQ